MQQRSDKKITFPNRWTNTCCSHNSHIPEELDESQDYIGMRRAAIRRTNFELGISSFRAEELKLVSKILYQADSCETFHEHELDYILFLKKDLLEWEPA